eukprot:64231-Pyramimonas_sp.AAC.1
MGRRDKDERVPFGRLPILLMRMSCTPSPCPILKKSNNKKRHIDKPVALRADFLDLRQTPPRVAGSAPSADPRDPRGALNIY